MSAPEWSMTPDVVPVKPMNRPIWTTLSTIANTMPVRVTASRTLSCTRLRRASDTMRPVLLSSVGDGGGSGFGDAEPRLPFAQVGEPLVVAVDANFRHPRPAHADDVHAEV